MVITTALDNFDFRSFVCVFVCDCGGGQHYGPRGVSAACVIYRERSCCACELKSVLLLNASVLHLYHDVSRQGMVTCLCTCVSAFHLHREAIRSVLHTGPNKILFSLCARKNFREYVRKYVRKSTYAGFKDTSSCGLTNPALSDASRSPRRASVARE